MKNAMVLVVMSRNRRSPLLEQLESCKTEVLAVCDCREARRILQTQLPIQVVVTDATLADGDWSQVLNYVNESDRLAELIVCAPVADIGLWRDVFARGAYDLLTEPFDAHDLRRTIEAAAARSRMRAFSSEYQLPAAS